MILVLLIGGFSLALLLFLLLRAKTGESRSVAEDPAHRRGVKAGALARAAGGPRPGSCPLCGSLLGSGERVKSDLTPGKGDRMMRIFGCPHCLALAGAPPRLCPVCRSEIESGGYAIARYFERPGRRHVHVLGCTGCRVSRRESVHGR